MKITKEMAEYCYKYGCKYYNNKINIDDAATIIDNETGLKYSIAFVYLDVCRNLLLGEVFNKVVDPLAIKVFFNNILRDFGKESLEKAIFVTRKHMKHYIKAVAPEQKIMDNICCDFEQKIK